MVGLFDRAFKGSDEKYALAEKALADALATHDESTPAVFPNTAYFAACIYEYTGIKVTTLADVKAAMEPIRAMMTRNYRTHDVFTSGIATSMAAEVIELCKYLDTDTPYNGEYHGHMNDAEVRELGVPLVTRDIPGFVVIIGPAPSEEEAEALIKGYQSRGIFVFLIGGIIDQAKNRKINMISVNFNGYL